MNLVQLLQNIGCKNARNDGMDNISSLRDGRWVEMFAEIGYDRGEFVFPDGRYSSFFLVLPDGNIASADNVMCGNGFYAVADELGIDADEILGVEPYGKFIMYTDEDGIEDEDTAISIWTPKEFMQKIELCRRLKTIKESVNISDSQNNMYTMENWTNDRTLKVKPGQCIDDDVYEQLRDSVPPAYSRMGVFQPGEAYSLSVDYEDLYQTFIRQEEGWLYVGLCKYGETTPTEQIDFYKNMQESKKSKKKNTIRLTESELKKVIAESVKRILSERRSLKSQSLYGIIKQHGGVKSNPCFDLANMMDEDIIGIVDYETIYDCKTERGLKDYALKKGFKLDKSDTVEYMQLNDGTYMLGVLRGGAFDYTNSKDRERKSGDFEALCDKRDERQRNRYVSNPNYYKWENKDAEDLFKNPFFRRKEGVWSDKDFRSNRITNAKRK